MVQFWLGGLAQKFRSFWMTVCTRENMSFFANLQLMLLVEENHTGASTSRHADNKMLYMEADRSRGRDGRGGSAHNGGRLQEKERRHNRHADNSSE